MPQRMYRLERRGARLRSIASTATLLAFLQLATGCLCSRPSPPPHDTTPSAHENLHAVLYMGTAAEYAALCRQTYTAATEAIRRHLQSPTFTALVEGAPTNVASLPPAVLMDIDETILDNGPHQEQDVIDDAHSFRPSSWKRWVALAEARPIPGAVEFINALPAQGIALVLVSNRTQEEREATRTNLARIGIETPITRMLLSGDAPGGSDKSVRREIIAREFRILANIGDDLNDFLRARGLSVSERRDAAGRHPEWWGTRWFILPNPVYGSWETSLRMGLPSNATDRAILDAKRSRLAGFHSAIPAVTTHSTDPKGTSRPHRR